MSTKLIKHRKLSIWLTVCFVVLLMIGSGIQIVDAFVGYGGYGSVKNINQSTITNSYLTISSGGFSGLVLVGEGTLGDTLPATNIVMNGGTSATLNGNVTNLRSYSSANIWFEWGSDTSYGSTTAPQIIGAIGTYSSNITHFDPTIIHYRFVIDNGDGKVYGSDQSFLINNSGLSAGYIMLMAFWGLVIAGVGLFMMWKVGLGDDPSIFIAISVVIFICVVVASVILRVLL